MELWEILAILEDVSQNLEMGHVEGVSLEVAEKLSADIQDVIAKLDEADFSYAHTDYEA